MLSTVIRKVSRLQAEDIITDPQIQAMKQAHRGGSLLFKAENTSIIIISENRITIIIIHICEKHFLLCRDRYADLSGTRRFPKQNHVLSR